MCVLPIAKSIVFSESKLFDSPRSRKMICRKACSDDVEYLLYIHTLIALYCEGQIRGTQKRTKRCHTVIIVAVVVSIFFLGSTLLVCLLAHFTFQKETECNKSKSRTSNWQIVRQSSFISHKEKSFLPRLPYHFFFSYVAP